MRCAEAIDRTIAEVRAAKEGLELALPELQFVVHSLKALEELDTTGQTRAAPRHEEVDRMNDLRLQFAAEVCVFGGGRGGTRAPVLVPSHLRWLLVHGVGG